MEKSAKEIESPMKISLQKNIIPSEKPVVAKKSKGAKTNKNDKENVHVNLKKKVAAPNLKEFNCENDENVRPFEI